MSRVGKFNLFLFSLTVIAFIFVMVSRNKEVVTSDLPKPVPVVKPSVEIVEQAESIFGYTSVGETPPGESETVHITKAITIINPHDFPVTIGGGNQ